MNIFPQHKHLILAALFLFGALVSAEDYLSNPAYIAQSGFGETEAAARQNALGGLSKFFQMTVSVQTTEKTRVDGSGSQSVLFDEVSVGSQTELFAVHYTKAKYSKKQKLYEVTAFIDRNEAWEVFRPKVEAKTNGFETFYSNAAFQTDSLLKIIEFTKAQQFARQSELEKTLDFSAALYPDSVMMYENTREHISTLEPLLRKLCRNCSVKIICDADFENCVKNRTADFFSKIGIILSQTEADYSCLVKISENKSELPAGTFYTPSLTVEIEKNGETLFSAAEQLKRTGAKDAHIARQRTYSALADCTEKLLNGHFLSFEGK